MLQPLKDISPAASKCVPGGEPEKSPDKGEREDEDEESFRVANSSWIIYCVSSPPSFPPLCSLALQKKFRFYDFSST